MIEIQGEKLLAGVLTQYYLVICHLSFLLLAGLSIPGKG